MFVTLEKFLDLLDLHGIKHRTGGVSLSLCECPACGQTDYKVLFRVAGVDENQPFFGRCVKGSCQTNYSSMSYLRKMGIPEDEISDCHGIDGQKQLEKLAQIDTPDEKLDIDSYKEKIEEKKPVIVDISQFKNIAVWLDHPSARYAVKRGFVRRFADIMKIDPENNAVVFIAYNDKNEPIGYQRRYLNPAMAGGLKTRTSKGFSKSRHILQFNNPGKDILICEGPFTALSAWHYGYHGVCTFGSGISDTQLGLILQEQQKKDCKIAISCEDDRAGRLYVDKISKFCYWHGIEVETVSPEYGNDLNDSWQAGKGIVVKQHGHISPAIPFIDIL